MDLLSLTAVFTAAGAIAWAAIITYFVLVTQALSFIPMPEGSRARVWAVGVLSALVVVLAVLDRGEAFSPNYAIEVALAFANLVAAASGVRVATKVVAPQLTSAANGAPAG